MNTHYTSLHLIRPHKMEIKRDRQNPQIVYSVEMCGRVTMNYQFGKYEFDAKRAELRRKGVVLKLESKVYLLLEILLIHNDRIVMKSEVIKHVWAGRVVSDGSIDNTLSDQAMYRYWA